MNSVTNKTRLAEKRYSDKLKKRPKKEIRKNTKKHKKQNKKIEKLKNTITIIFNKYKKSAI